MEQCGLTDVSRKIIGHLSKGYRQRVGLADALVHEPELIILDEPTIGLDPEPDSFRAPVDQGSGPQPYGLISTHILPEVEMTCSRVLILHEGKILAADTPENLQKFMSNKQPGDRGDRRAARRTCEDCWEQMAEIEHFDLSPAEGEFLRCALTPRDGIDLRPQIFALARERGWMLRELTRSRFPGRYLCARDPAERGGGKLMQAYLTLTRRELAGFFVSLTGYVIIAAAVFLMGLSFVVLLTQLQGEPTPVPVTQLFYSTPLLLADPLAGRAGDHHAPVCAGKIFRHF